MNNKKYVELLAPSGSRLSAIAAVNCGADAIYLGGKSFNARRSADNFSDEELEDIIDYCHLRGVSVNVTLNTLYNDDELDKVVEFAKKLYRMGADALIIQDMGLFSILRGALCDISLNASTQLTAHNSSAVSFLHNEGFNRVVLARELSLDEIEKIIKENPDCAIECFVHGAICVSYSGRCLFSSFIGERSGNRGACAQPCRMKFTLRKDERPVASGYLLSPCDMESVKNIPKLVEIGVDAFKIEGRMKSPEYVAMVTKTYRKYLDLALEGKKALPSEKDISELWQVFNRGGYSLDGYHNTFASRKMISENTPKNSGIEIGYIRQVLRDNKYVIKINKGFTLINGDGIVATDSRGKSVGAYISSAPKGGSSDSVEVILEGRLNKGDRVFRTFDKALSDSLKPMYSEDMPKREVAASFRAVKGEDIMLSLSCDKVGISVRGSAPEAALNKPTDKAAIIRQLEKSGNTPFIIRADNIEADEDIFIPVSQLNSLRREGVEALENALIKAYKRAEVKVSAFEEHSDKASEQQLCALVPDVRVLEEIAGYGFKRIYIEYERENLSKIDRCAELCHKADCELFVAFPSIMREDSFDEIMSFVQKMESGPVDGYLLRNPMHNFNCSKKIAFDYTFNVFNKASYAYYKGFCDSITLSTELKLPLIRNIADCNSELVVYGRMVLMTTHQCPIGNFKHSREGKFCPERFKAAGFELVDRTGAVFPLEASCDFCYCRVLNSRPLCVARDIEAVRKTGCGLLRLDFTTEAPQRAGDIAYLFDMLVNKGALDDRAKRVLDDLNKEGITGGHYFRGDI